MKNLVIVVEGLHLGFLGCYGNEWIDTPILDRLAAEGVVFDRHFADCPEPAAARRAWRTGLNQLPSFTNKDESNLAAAADLIRLLRGQGVDTTLVLAKGRPWAREFAADWDHVEWVSARGEGTVLERCLEGALAGLDRLEDQRNGLLWLELPTLLPPWEVPEEDLARYLQEEADDEPLPALVNPQLGLVPELDDAQFLQLQRTCAAAVTYLDTGLGLLLEELRKRGMEDQVWVWVLGDRGLALGEHQLIGDGRPWLHEERIHVPLLVRPPDPTLAGRRMSALTQPVDLLPTLLELHGVPVPPGIHGHSLVPLLYDQVEALRPYACAGQQLDEGLEFALRTPNWSLILPVHPCAGDAPRATQLYVQPDDRWEVNDVRLHHLELVEQLEQVVQRFVTATRQPGPLQVPPLPQE